MAVHAGDFVSFSRADNTSGHINKLYRRTALISSLRSLITVPQAPRSCTYAPTSFLERQYHLVCKEPRGTGPMATIRVTNRCCWHRPKKARQRSPMATAREPRQQAKVESPPHANPEPESALSLPCVPSGTAVMSNVAHYSSTTYPYLPLAVWCVQGGPYVVDGAQKQSETTMSPRRVRSL